jgi:hypothetical protein
VIRGAIGVHTRNRPFCRIFRKDLTQGIKIYRKTVQFVLVACFHDVPVSIEYGETVYVRPDIVTVGVKNMRAVQVYIYAVPVLRVAVSANMVSSFDHQARLAMLGHFVGEDAAEQASPDNQIVMVPQDLRSAGIQ